MNTNGATDAATRFQIARRTSDALVLTSSIVIAATGYLSQEITWFIAAA